MLTQSQVDSVEHLVREGMSWRKIASLTRVSRGSVRTIANGTRGIRVSRVKTKPRTDSKTKAARVVVALNARRASRCSGCGGLVYLPCRVCELRSSMGVLRSPRNER